MHCGADLLFHLHRWRQHGVGVIIDSDGDRQESFPAEPRKEAGLEQRGLAQPRLAEQNSEGLALDAAEQVDCFPTAAVRENLRILGIGSKSRQRVVIANGRCGASRKGIGSDHGAGLARRRRKARLTIVNEVYCVSVFCRLRSTTSRSHWMISGEIWPAGAGSQCLPANRSGAPGGGYRVSSITTGTMNCRSLGKRRSR